MIGGSTIGRLVAIAALLFVVSRWTPAFADRVDDLSQMLSSSSDKTRLEAVAALARLGDKRTLRPLVQALHDPNAQVRALAAAALGHLGHRAALPALRTAASDDTDGTVRKRAAIAAIEVARANHLPEQPAVQAAAAPPHHGSGFGHSPHAVHDRPDLYVIVKSSSDDSPGRADKAMRKQHADIVRDALLESFREAPQVTLAADDAERWGLDPLHIDVSVVKLELVDDGAYVDLQADLRLAISDSSGKMLSFLSGGAKVQVLRSKFDARFLPDMRREALESAMRGMFEKLLAHLRQTQS